MTCSNCEKEFTSKIKEAKFCSSSCAATFNNKLYPKRKLSNKCANCSNTCFASRKYCSKECYRVGIKAKKTSKDLEQIDHYCQNKTCNKQLTGTKTKWCSNTCNITQLRRDLKLQSIDYKGGCCSLCGYSKCVRALHFHHLDPKQKDFAISSCGHTKTWEKMKIELDKCILVCSNCHAELHDNL